MVLLPPAPDCAPWCDTCDHDGWDDDGRSITHVCRRSVTVHAADGTPVVLVLEQFTDVDEEGRAVTAEPTMTVNGSAAYPLSTIVAISEGLFALLGAATLAA